MFATNMSTEIQAKLMNSQENSVIFAEKPESIEETACFGPAVQLLLVPLSFLVLDADD